MNPEDIQPEESVDPARPTVAVFHPWMRLAGSEAATMWAVQALMDDHEVTLVTPADFTLRELNHAFGTTVEPWAINTLQLSRLPGEHSPAHLPRLRLNHFECQARKLAPQFNVCISGYNLLDFGRPGLHLIGDFSWDPPYGDQLAGRAVAHPLPRHHDSMLYRCYGWVADHLFHWRTRNLLGGDDCLIANSHWTARHLGDHYGVEGAPILPPPIHTPAPPSGTSRDPLGFVWMARVSPENRLERAVEILTAVRALGHDIRMHVVGRFGDDPYGTAMSRLTASRSWITLHGDLAAADKFALLYRQTFALHTNPAEGFSITVGEMAACGCVPFVFADGGATEVVADDGLIWHTPSDAVVKIHSLLGRPSRREDLAAALSLRAARYSPPQFIGGLRQLVSDFLLRARQRVAA